MVQNVIGFVILKLITCLYSMYRNVMNVLSGLKLINSFGAFRQFNSIFGTSVKAKPDAQRRRI